MSTVMEYLAMKLNNMTNAIQFSSLGNNSLLVLSKKKSLDSMSLASSLMLSPYSSQVCNYYHFVSLALQHELVVNGLPNVS